VGVTHHLKGRRPLGRRGRKGMPFLREGGQSNCPLMRKKKKKVNEPQTNEGKGEPNQSYELGGSEGKKDPSVFS